MSESGPSPDAGAANLRLVYQPWLYHQPRIPDRTGSVARRAAVAGAGGQAGERSAGATRRSHAENGLPGPAGQYS
ncbi:hypothetical protein D3C72_1437780 [compost metagenome]